MVGGGGGGRGPSPGSATGVRKPWGVTINQRGEIVVTESDGYCVSILCPNGEKLLSFGQGQFKNPHGVAVDNELNILVADGGNHRIQKFTPDGQFLTAVGAQGKGPLQFDYPTDIVVCNAINKKPGVCD